MGSQGQTNASKPLSPERLAHAIDQVLQHSYIPFAQDATFIGRERELATIEQCFADPGCRLLTLVGPGGIGKTRLAIQAARRLPLPIRMRFVPLQPLTSPDFIISCHDRK